MKIESHIAAIKESIRAIKICLREGVTNWQRTIGFHCLAAAVDLLDIYLRQKNLIDPGLHLKHNWFLSIKNAAEKLPDFAEKNRVLLIF